MVCIDPRLEPLVRSALPHTDGLTFLSPAESYVRPATTIKSFRKLLDDLVAEGAERIRIVGQIPLATTPQSWHGRSEEHTSELQSLMRISYAVFCLNKKKYSISILILF